MCVLGGFHAVKFVATEGSVKNDDWTQCTLFLVSTFVAVCRTDFEVNFEGEAWTWECKCVNLRCFGCHPVFLRRKKPFGCARFWVFTI